jgi:hypothetical protein
MKEDTWTEGKVRIDTGEVIAAPGISLEQLERTTAWATAKMSEHTASGRKYKTVGMGPVLICGYECYLTEYFADTFLEGLVITLSETEENRLGFPATHPFWQRPGELDFLKKWVHQQTNRKSPAEFKWGHIAAVFDDKGGFDAIKFRYVL